MKLCTPNGRMHHRARVVLRTSRKRRRREINAAGATATARQRCVLFKQAAGGVAGSCCRCVAYACTPSLRPANLLHTGVFAWLIGCAACTSSAHSLSVKVGAATRLELGGADGARRPAGDEQRVTAAVLIDLSGT